MKVFYYRSDLIDNESNVSKNSDGKRLNYENYVNKGKWYIILDEAHKGQAELSLKKNYYNEMAENGFIFNFSATFVDNIEVIFHINFNETNLYTFF
jgi:superfamily II DNA or RNA helicase